MAQTTADRPWRDLPPESGRRAAPRSFPAWPTRSSRPSARACPSTRCRPRGPVRPRRCGAGWRRRCAVRRPVRAPRDRGADPRREIYVSSAGASCARAAPSRRCWPPTASARGWPGGAWRRRARPPGSSPRRSTCWPSRSSPTSTRSRPSRSRATRSSRPRRPARPSAGAGALARLLVQDPPADPDAVQAAAEAAGWPLPERLAAVVTGDEDADALALRLGQGTIAVGDPAGACALVPDPDAPGRRAQLERALDGQDAALGPAGPWTAAPLSAQRARSALALGGRRPDRGGRPPARPAPGHRPAPDARPGRRPPGAAGRRDRRPPGSA